MFRVSWFRRSATGGAGSAVLSVDRCRELAANYKKTKSKSVVADARAMFQTSFWPEGQRFAVQDACDVLQAAALFKPALSNAQSPGVHAAVSSIIECPDRLAPQQYASAFGAVTALHHPQQFELLLKHVRRASDGRTVEQMEVEHLSTVVSAYGRTQTRHPSSVTAFADRAVELVPTAKNIAHVANLAYAFAHLQLDVQHAVWDNLAEATTRLIDQAVPLVAATLLNAFATSWAETDEPLSSARNDAIGALEASITSRVSELPPALISSGALSLTTLGRMDFLSTAHKRVLETASTFGPAHVADTFRAIKLTGKPDTDLMGTLAERAAADIKRYKTKDIVAVLDVLARFELFDSQLTDLAIQHVLGALKNRVSLDVNVLACFVRTLATTNTRNHILLGAVQRMVSESPEALDAEGAKHLQEALRTFAMTPSAELESRFNALASSNRDGK